MSYPIKAQVGDYIRIDGRVLRVVFVNDRDEQPEYELKTAVASATAISATTTSSSNPRCAERSEAKQE